jgi:uncharacterized protein YgbK (DUF1537 family)
VALDVETIVRGGAGEASTDEAASAVIQCIADNQHVVVHTGRDVNRLSSSVGQQLGKTLGRVIRKAIESNPVQRICIAGGDTASHASVALGIEAIEMIAPAWPGAPLCRVHAPGSPVDGVQMNFKGGQVGGDDYFLALARGDLKGAA